MTTLNEKTFKTTNKGLIMSYPDQTINEYRHRVKELEQCLKALRCHINSCPIGWYDGKIIKGRDASDDDVITWFMTLSKLTNSRNEL